MGNSDSKQNQNDDGLRVIKIMQDSPASQTDLCIYTDFIIDIADKPEGFSLHRDFYKYVIINENKTIRMFVYNILTQKNRYIDLLLTRDWPNSDFLLGFKFRHESISNAQKNIYRILNVFNPVLKGIVVPKNFFFMAIEEFSFDNLEDLKAKLKLYKKTNLIFFDVGTLNVIIVNFQYNPRLGLGFELGTGYLHDLQFIIQSLIKNREQMNSLQFEDSQVDRQVEMMQLKKKYVDFQNQERQKLNVSQQNNSQQNPQNNSENEMQQNYQQNLDQQISNEQSSQDENLRDVQIQKRDKNQQKQISEDVIDVKEEAENSNKEQDDTEQKQQNNDDLKQDDNENIKQEKEKQNVQG